MPPYRDGRKVPLRHCVYRLWRQLRGELVNQDAVAEMGLAEAEKVNQDA